MAGFDLDKERAEIRELFEEEVSSLISQMEECYEAAKAISAFSKENIEEIYRIIHTIKADATMMLFEDIAVPTRAFEKILFYYRYNSYNVCFDEFSKYIESYLVFINKEFGAAVGSSKEVTMEECSSYADMFLEYVEQLSRRQNGAANQENNGTAPAVTKNPGAYISDQEFEILVELIKRFEKQEKLIEDYHKEKFHSVPDEISDMRTLLEITHNWFQSAFMVPFGHLAVKINKIIDEMNQRLVDKQAEIEIKGKDVLIERNRIEKISAALLHLIRNSMDHGIETREERIAQGKDATGHIVVECRANDQKTKFYVTVTDDGKGFDRRKLVENAVKQGLINEGAELCDEEILGLSFISGVSTSIGVAEYSGQGVGMDVVKHYITELGGHVKVSSTEGKGSSVTMEIGYMLLENERRSVVFDGRR